MRYVYSVLRFVPDPARGEFVNVGLIVGSEDGGEWKLRLVDNMKRARALDDKDVLPTLWSVVNHIERQFDAYSEALESARPSGLDLSESWLEDLWETSRNIVQFSRPAPVLAEDADSALDVLFGELLVDPRSRYRPTATKIPVLSTARRSYAQEGVRKGVHLAERCVVKGPAHSQLFDFVVANGRAVQLAQAWSFQRPDQDQLAEDLKAWAWSVGDIRDGGGTVTPFDDDPISVPPTVDVAAIFTLQEENGPSAVYREAIQAFEKVGVEPVPVADSERVGRRARQLLVSAGVQLSLQ